MFITKSSIAPIHTETAVNLPLAKAFMRFTVDLQTWWPRELTWSGPVLEAIGMGLHVNAPCYERGPFGFTCHWGRVLAWEPPMRLMLAWQINPRREPEPNPYKASTVEVKFEPAGPNETRILLNHRAFENHGEGCEDYRAALASPRGWPYLLECYTAAAAAPAVKMAA